MSINLSDIQEKIKDTIQNLTTSNPKEIEDPKDQQIELQLGDIIRIEDPTNDNLNRIFIIDYIDKSKIKLIEETDLRKLQLKIDSNGLINNGTITGIELLYRNKYPGYVKQNNLFTGEWINIYFEGDIPMLLTGKITNVEEDMIEVQTYPDDNIIYINFDYKGIPEDLPIESIQIRDAPEAVQQIQTELEKQDVPSVQNDLTAEEVLSQWSDEIFQEDFQENVEKRNMKQKKPLKQIIEANEIEFGDYVGAIQEYIDIDKEKYRYNLDTQTNSLLNDLLSNIPPHKRTDSILNNIHIMITRFIQLRELGSVFDKNKNIVSILNKNANYKPLAEYLNTFKNKLYWIMLVAKNIKKIYDTKDTADPELVENSDISIMNTIESLQEIKQLFNQYKSNSNDLQNKYTELYTSLNLDMTPFLSINPEKNKDVICEHEVNNDMDVIIDNLGDMYSSVSYNSRIYSTRFVLQKYNTGLTKLDATNLKGSNMIANRVNLTNNDIISVQSILTLPEPTVRFSQINLPSSDLLVKSNLNLSFLNYWELLKKNTPVSKIEIDSLDTQLQYDENNFVDNIKNYILELQDNDIPKEKYKKFLNIVVPKTKILFNLVKKYIKGKLSLVNLIHYLEPFLIYSNDLTYMQYVDMNRFIKEQINEYNKAFVENSRRFSTLKNILKQEKLPSVLFEILNKNNDVKNKVFEKYGFNDEKNRFITDSELLKKITVDDCGNLYNTAIAFENIALMFPTELNAIFDLDKNKLNQSLEKDSQENKCKNYIISKKYTNKEELLEDNGKDIYFDKIYDTTPYYILDEYTREQNRLSPEEFYIFLSDKLIKKYKYNTYDAEYISDSLINGFKKVVDNQYAILNNENIIEEKQKLESNYYVRRNNEWIQDKTVDPAILNGIDDNETLCLIQEKCIPTDQVIDSSCDSLAMTKDTIVSNALKEIMSEFDKNYEITKEELNAKLNKFLDLYTELFDKIENIHKYEFYKYNNYQYKLGLDEKDLSKIIQSPYNKLRDFILGQSDFLKKQNDIIKFTMRFTREFNEKNANIHNNEMENKYWLYCKKTGAKLLPTFFYTLASVFIQNNNVYDETMNNIIKDQGVLSDDGGNWEDKYSGYIIKPIDWDVEEGYENGFRIRSREILEKDLGQTSEDTKKKLNPQSQSIYNIIQSISSFMGISIDNQSEFIINSVTNLLNNSNVLTKEVDYNKRVEEMAKKGKKLPEYKDVYNSTFLYTTLGMFLIAIQTSIPSLRTRKTFPGCVRSFNGFPIQGEGDYSGLNYLACVVNKMKSPVSPWNILSRVKEDKIAENIKTFILKYLLPTQEVEQKIKEKIDYLLLNPEEEIPEEHSLLIWNGFLPPLQKFKLKTIQNITHSFSDTLLKEIRSGSPSQIEKLLVVQSKIIFYSFAIQEAIQSIVEKKNLLLKSSVHPYMDNACCNEKNNSLTVLQYFINANSEIDVYNNNIKELSHAIIDVQILTNSVIFLSSVNTKRFYPSLSSNFNEETIYYAFTKYCKFNSFSPIPSDLLSLCKDKPDYISSNDSIQEKIRKFKRDGRSYLEEDLLRLLQIVSRKNIVHTNIPLNEYTPIQRIRDLFESFDKRDEETIASSFRNLMDSVLDTYDISVTSDSEEMRKLKNYLYTSNSKMKKQLLDFIKQKSKIKTAENKNIDAFINNLALWTFDNSRNSENISDDAMYNYIQFFKTFIFMLSKVFPNMILNQQIQSIQPPKYWGLSSKHTSDIKNIVETYYEPIKKFYGNNKLQYILNKIQEKCKFILLLSNETPAFTNIKTGENIIYSVFDKRTSTLLYEYYLLQVFTSYIDLTDNPLMLKRVAPEPINIDELFDREDELVTTEPEFIQGDVNQLKETVSQLLVGYIKIMMDTKKTIDVSYESIMDKVFKLKEKEKDTFTDRLQLLNDEERTVDTILKINKLGLWNKGLAKGLKEYDPENYDQERDTMTKIAEIEKKVRQNPDVDDQNVDIYMDDYMNEMDAAEEIDEDVQLNESEDYMDGDYYGDEENLQEYN